MVFGDRTEPPRRHQRGPLALRPQPQNTKVVHQTGPRWVTSNFQHVPSETWVISHVPMFHITQPLGIWSTKWLLFQVMSNLPKSWDSDTNPIRFWWWLLGLRWRPAEGKGLAVSGPSQKYGNEIWNGIHGAGIFTYKTGSFMG